LQQQFYLSCMFAQQQQQQQLLAAGRSVNYAAAAAFNNATLLAAAAANNNTPAMVTAMAIQTPCFLPATAANNHTTVASASVPCEPTEAPVATQDLHSASSTHSSDNNTEQGGDDNEDGVDDASLIASLRAALGQKDATIQAYQHMADHGERSRHQQVGCLQARIRQLEQETRRQAQEVQQWPPALHERRVSSDNSSASSSPSSNDDDTPSSNHEDENSDKDGLIQSMKMELQQLRELLLWQGLATAGKTAKEMSIRSGNDVLREHGL